MELTEREVRALIRATTLVADAHTPDIETAKGLIGILHFRDVVLHPGMNIQEAIAVFDAAEAESLAVVETDGEHLYVTLRATPRGLREAVNAVLSR